MNSIIYGPVPSWRLGRSLGIDVVSTKEKTCSFDCVYCQLGKTIHRVNQRDTFVSLELLADEFESTKEIPIDYVTFSGVAEPTLASNLGQAIDLAKSKLGFPVAVLTNSSLMFLEDVRRDLAHADVVVAKLDVPEEGLFRSINRPVTGISFKQTVEGIRRFRREYSGILALQIMFIDANRGSASQMAALAEEIMPDEVQLNTPLRPCAVKPLREAEMRSIKDEFARFGDKAVMVYESTKPMVEPVDMAQTLRRRPQL
ncbi:MAG: radical SAM protein [Chloroflexi bacterium]|nr:radical SAM protein [Chloroflexota bacterium]